MLTLCLPVYRYDVRPLVTELLRQRKAIGVNVEILVYDDASPDDGDWGKAELRQTEGITYVELKTNLGRATIRNRLAREAYYDYVILMDADGWPNRDYLQRWLDEVRDIIIMQGDEHPEFVSVGGRYYAPEPPKDETLHLHWWYGSQRESLSASQRNQQGYRAFHSNNFLAYRSVLLRHPFPEDHTGYGHEDTLWGQQLEALGVPLYNLENAVIHLGLEASYVFLKKQREAIRNLALLRRQALHPPRLSAGLRCAPRTRLIDFAERFPRLSRLARLLPQQRLIDYLQNNKRPRLYALDLLKLYWWGQE